MTIISGYASVFNRLDNDRDIILKGAFSNLDDNIKLLWQHNLKQVIGVVKTIKEDKVGLYITAELNPLYKKVSQLIKENKVTGLSIGFKPLNTTYDKINRTRIIKSLKLFEISVVARPANTMSQIISLST